MSLAQHKFSAKVLLNIMAVLFVMIGVAYLLLPDAQVVASRIGFQNSPRPVYSQTKNAEMPWSTPTHLQIPQLGIDLNVQNGGYNSYTKQWGIDSQHAFYLSTPTPIIYGHAILNVFGKLAHAKPGDLLVITTQNSQKLYFEYTSSLVINANDDSILHTKTQNQIFVMTCTGPDWQQRRVSQFNYVGAGL